MFRCKQSRLLVALCILTVPLGGCTRVSQTLLQQSRIDGNVPARANFDQFLVRDLDAYFSEMFKTPVKVKYRLLRHGPTQSGVSDPKFYAWVNITDGQKLDEAGAVRLAAIERERFDITDFVSAKEIRRDPDAINKIFPTALCSAIRERALHQ